MPKVQSVVDVAYSVFSDARSLAELKALVEQKPDDVVKRVEKLNGEFSLLGLSNAEDAKPLREQILEKLSSDESAESRFQALQGVRNLNVKLEKLKSGDLKDASRQLSHILIPKLNGASVSAGTLSVVAEVILNKDETDESRINLLKVLQEGIGITSGEINDENKSLLIDVIGEAVSNNWNVNIGLISGLTNLKIDESLPEDINQACQTAEAICKEPQSLFTYFGGQSGVGEFLDFEAKVAELRAVIINKPIPTVVLDTATATLKKDAKSVTVKVAADFTVDKSQLQTGVVLSDDGKDLTINYDDKGVADLIKDKGEGFNIDGSKPDGSKAVWPIDIKPPTGGDDDKIPDPANDGYDLVGWGALIIGGLVAIGSFIASAEDKAKVGLGVVGTVVAALFNPWVKKLLFGSEEQPNPKPAAGGG